MSKLPPSTPMFISIMTVTMKPYSPWVPGRSTSTSILPNFEESSDMTPMAASAAMPTPLMEPMPAIPVAMAAPSSAQITPLLMILCPP